MNLKHRELSILTVGSGDGSFERCLVEYQGLKNIEITFYESLDIEVHKYEQSDNNISYLLNNKIIVKGNIDATKLDQIYINKKFDIIIFNHPMRI